MLHQTLTVELLCGISRDGRSLIREPLPQKEARQRPMIAIATTEHAGGTAWLLPRNCVARSPARVELCIPVHNEIVLLISSSCLRQKQNYFRGKPVPNPQHKNANLQKWLIPVSECKSACRALRIATQAFTTIIKMQRRAFIGMSIEKWAWIFGF